jgi:hypothetical protein
MRIPNPTDAILAGLFFAISSTIVSVIGIPLLFFCSFVAPNKLSEATLVVSEICDYIFSVTSALYNDDELKLNELLDIKDD